MEYTRILSGIISVLTVLINLIHEGSTKYGVFKIHNDSGQNWTDAVSHQLGNYDYLMGSDIEYRNRDVIEEMKNWIKWFAATAGVDGMRLDALKHIDSDFLQEWIRYIKEEIKPDCYILGEFWNSEAEEINDFSEKMDEMISCFDVPLHYNFSKASEEGENYDLRNILKGSFSEIKPSLSVTFVENHDTQPLQALESSIKDWFKPIAYAIILMSEFGYPCVFYADLFGVEYVDLQNGNSIDIIIKKVEILPQLLEARKLYANGKQINFMDDPNCIAIIRVGDRQHPGCIVIISNGSRNYKELDLGFNLRNSRFMDFLGFCEETVKSDQFGKAVFTVNARSLSIWVKI